MINIAILLLSWHHLLWLLTSLFSRHELIWVSLVTSSIANNYFLRVVSNFSLLWPISDKQLKGRKVDIGAWFERLQSAVAEKSRNFECEWFFLNTQREFIDVPWYSLAFSNF